MHGDVLEKKYNWSEFVHKMICNFLAEFEKEWNYN
jgi:hypothetical protein